MVRRYGTAFPRSTRDTVVVFFLFPSPEKVVPLRILYEKYGTCLMQDNMIKAMALLTDYESKEMVLSERNIYVKNPNIKIRVRLF